MKGDLSPRMLAVVAGVAVVLLALIGWFGVVSPQRSDAVKLDARIADEGAKLRVANLLARPQGTGKGKKTTTTLNVLSKAMPAQVKMSNVLRQVQSLADAAEITLDGFAPAIPVPLAGYEAIPVDITVTGRYANIQSFLRRLRVQARSTDGGPLASGRLFDVQTLGLTGGGTGPPELSATIRMATFVYNGVVPVDPTTTATPDSTASGTDGVEGSG